MSDDMIIRASGLGKTYKIHRSARAQLVDMLRPDPRRGTLLRALDGVSLEVRRGESIGIIGRNGAGKSTLLQLICGLLHPSAGQLQVHGRIAGLLELGAGFDPEFSGRDNVQMAAAILGLSEMQIAERFESIVAFADIGPFIERPVREYSSGMYARLAFAVCIHVDADLLVIDEILSVGDAAFQRKCAHAIQGFLAGGGTVLFVSHDEGAVLAHCERAIWLDGGRIRADGPSRTVCRLYAQALHDPEADHAAGIDTASAPAAADELVLRSTPASTDPRWRGANPIAVLAPEDGAVWHGEGGGEIEHIGLFGSDGAALGVLHGGDEVELRISCRAHRPLVRPVIGYILRNGRGENLSGDNTFLRYRDAELNVPAGATFVAHFLLQIPYLPPGDHFFAPSIIEGTQRDHIHLHWIENALCLRVTHSPVTLGAVGVPMRRATLDAGS